MTEIIVVLISSGLTLIGTIITVVSTSRNQARETDKKLAVMQAQMEAMKEDLRSHNNYAKMFSENIPAIKTHMKDIDRRLDGLERSSA